MRASWSSLTSMACSMRWWSGFGPRGAERLLERVEDQTLGLGADRVDRDLPARLVRPADGRRQVVGLPVDDLARPVVEMDLEPLDAQAVPHRPPLVIGVPVAEELVAEIQGEIGVDTNRQGVVGGEGLSSSRRSGLTHCSEIEVQPRLMAASIASSAESRP